MKYQGFPDRLKIDAMPFSSRLKKPGRFFTSGYEEEEPLNAHCWQRVLCRL